MKIINSNRFFLNVPAQPNQWLHLATVQHGLREYMCFQDKLTEEVYIEEVTGGLLEKIEDDSLAQDLENFLAYNNILNINRPILADKDWLYRQPKK